MKLIMENWRHYSNQVNEDKNFQLVLESIKNAETQDDANIVVERWIEEQEKILNEFEFLKKGKEFISKKINDFLVGLYFKGVNMIESVLSAGFKVAKPVLQVLVFIGRKVSGVLKKFPFIAKIAKAALLALVMVCAMAVANVAFAGEPDPEKVESLVKIINTLQGIMADQLGDIGGLPGAQDILDGASDPELKAQYADGINVLEDMVQKVESGQIKDVNDIQKNAGKSEKVVRSTLKFLKNLLTNPPEGDGDAVDTAINKWQSAGEAIEKAFYKFFKMTSASGETSRETIRFSGK